MQLVFWDNFIARYKAAMEQVEWQPHIMASQELDLEKVQRSTIKGTYMKITFHQRNSCTKISPSNELVV